MELASMRIPHMPDLLFVQWCEETFGVNRGVYNTIDAWFYERGLSDIVKRRRCIVSFLNSQVNGSLTGKKMKFGHGGLTTCLNDYWARRQSNQVGQFVG